MIVKLNTGMVNGLFSGTYESIWEPTEYNEEGTEEVEIEYDQKDLMKSIVGVYQQNEKYIVSELSVPFIKSIHFNGTFSSPREYNFSTDVLDFTLNIDKKALYKTLDSLKSDTSFALFLDEHYRSCDGFISFTPNNYVDIIDNIINEGQEHNQAIAAVINYLSKNTEMHGGCSIEEMMQDDWQSNGYNGLDYEVVKE
jgi:hypothetical protein